MKTAPFCDSIAKLASELELQLVKPNEAESARLTVLKEMPKYLEMWRLDLFDSAFKKEYQDVEDETRLNYRAIETLAELAYENLYVEFSINDSIKTYEWLITEFKKIDIRVSPNLDMSGW